MPPTNIDSLRSQWSILYSQTLPKLARAKDAAQPKWPVTLDHCFARIILDNTVGRGALQWDDVIKKPAVKHMDEAQLKEAIQLGNQIQNGEVNLVELDQKSLEARGKGGQKYNTSRKRKEEGHDSLDNERIPSSKKMRIEKKQSVLSFTRSPSRGNNTHQLASPVHALDEAASSVMSNKKTSRAQFPNPNTMEFLVKIQDHPSLTPYRKRLYSTLLSVPPGCYTNYQAMATFLNSSARAVGSGMRNNPYAPDVPCHRVLASDGSIGGFFGSWGEEGKHAGKKKDLLRQEGVFFDSKGRVKGPVFRNFEDLSKAKFP